MKKKEKLKYTAILIMAGIVGIAMLSGTAMAAGMVHNNNTGVDYATIQSAIDGANPGSEIHVDSGIYYENLEVNKDGLILKGIDTGGEGPVVNANGIGNGINITADNVVIDGFTVTGSASDGGESAGIFVISNSYMEKNHIVIKNNNVSGNGGNGIYLRSANENQIVNNTVNSNSAEGIFLYSSSNNLLSNNTASRNNWGGISLHLNSDSNTLRNNSVSNNSYGIQLGFQTIYNIVTDNTVNFNGYGLYIASGAENILTNNTASSNGMGIFILDGEQNKIYRNNFVNNGLSVDDRTGDKNIWNDTAEGNFWSDYTGLDTDSNGIGDTPYWINCNNFVSCGEGSEDHYPLMTPYNGEITPTTLDISGAKFNDTNGNGVKDMGEIGLPSWIIKVSTTSGDLIESTTTDANGNYVFTDLQPGNYIVSEEPQTGWAQTAPTPIPPGVYSITLSGVDQTGLDFGARITLIPTPTETPTPLTVSITSPTDDYYSEELVNFKGTANGGIPPYTYTWTSNQIGTLSTTTTESTINEFSKNIDFNNIQENNKHTISLTVQDSSGSGPVTQTVTLNVVKQKIRILVVPVTGESAFDEADAKTIEELNNSVRNFYWKSSYNAIQLNITKHQPILNLVKEEGFKDVREAVIASTLKRLFAEDGFKDSAYETILIVDTGYFLPENGGGVVEPNDIKRIMNDKELKYPEIVAIVSIRDNNPDGVWDHETGHTLGYTVETSEKKDGKKIALWDLYNFGNVEAWDIMARGEFVWNKTETKKEFNQPMDMSVLSKIKLGWLSEQPISEMNKEYPVMSMENMRYGENILVYKSVLSLPPLYDVKYNIEARELTRPSYYKWNINIPDTEIPIGYWWDELINGILIYKTSCYLGDYYCSINIQRPETLLSGFNKGPTLSATDSTSAEYTDYSEFVTFKVTESNPNHPYSAKIKVSPCIAKCVFMKGVKLTNPISIKWGILMPFYSPNINITSPDLDLHAYTLDGKLHVGMNYTSGLFEMQIPGAVASGDMTGGEEWIFVPVDTKVQYFVSSHDVQQYLSENPDIDPANATMNYTTEFMEYGDNPQLTQLPDGNYTVTNRTISTPMESTIGPGETKEVLSYNLSFSSSNKKTAKSGSAAPIKFNVTDWNGKIVDNAIANVYVVSGGIETNATSKGKANIGNLAEFNTTEQQYGYILDTSPIPLGIATIRIRLDDGTAWEAQIDIRR